MVRTQRNAWIHCAATIAVTATGLILGITHMEWALVIFAISSVLTAEAMNTAIEQLADIVQPAHDKRIGLLKDIAAGGVLIASGGAFLIGLLVFWPHFALCWTCAD